ncbi:MAG: KOW domain-containing RNA-binding protein [Clostridiales bacterium]|nr:KOW domain-containing RNA-binding protein [Clostridiales bacterium]MCC8106590.1 KOW domain-containing RNA-binding protein [Clostridiales bacterium]
MKVWTSEKLAVSKAGHDKGSLNLVLEETQDYVLLADGRLRTLEHPKKKNPKHVQMITHLPEELLEQMKEITLDAHVRKVLKKYRMMQEQRGQGVEKSL